MVETENKAADAKIPPKKPKLSKAERRALQEQQRAAKALQSGSVNPGRAAKGDAKNSVPSSNTLVKAVKNVPTGKVDKTAKKDIGQFVETNKIMLLFSHLPQYQDRSKDTHLSGVVLQSFEKKQRVNLHPIVLALGVKYADGSIRGANLRCRAMLEAYKIAIGDYKLPEETKSDIPTLLDQQVMRPSFQHWTSKCRPHAISMGNAFTFLKFAISNLSRDVSLESAQNDICDQIDAYIQEKITFADRMITKHAMSKIKDGDVILVFGRSEVIQVLLLAAVRNGKKFRVIIVDSRPFLEGRQMLRNLVQKKVNCTYVLLNALSHVMKEVTKVFLGAAALSSDGSVLNRIGTSSIALSAKSYNVPVLVCCETYKISNRVQLESFSTNELGNPLDVVRTGHGEGNHWFNDCRENKFMKVLNFMYDLTPSEYISGIVTEMGILPVTSVAVLLREMNITNSIL